MNKRKAIKEAQKLSDEINTHWKYHEIKYRGSDWMPDNICLICELKVKRIYELGKRFKFNPDKDLRN